MEGFVPGAEYGSPYENFIWVCTNAGERSFEKCDPSTSVAVWQGFVRKVQMAGLGRTTFVYNSGCLLGCKKEGTTVALYSKHSLAGGDPHVRYFRNVTLEDVDRILGLLGR